MIGVRLRGRDENDALTDAAEPRFEPNAYLSIAGDNTVTVRIFKHEMGQGVVTGLAMIVAEELGADWESIKTELVPYTPETRAAGHFETGGSSTIVSLWQPLREAGATAREMLIAAASARWNVAPESCDVTAGSIVNRGSGERLTFGELAAEAALIATPQEVSLRDPRTYTLVGRPFGGLHGREIVSGQLRYSMDVKVPGMLYAAVVRAPVVGASVVRIASDGALAVAGVRHVLRISAQGDNGYYAHGVVEGVAVLADSTWAAFRGRQALEVEWDEGRNGTRDDDTLRDEFRQAALGPLSRKTAYGDPDAALARATQRHAATYEHPYLAHALMEPLNAVAHVRNGHCELWAGSQSVRRTSEYVAHLLQIEPDRVTFHAHPSGGGFGRRFFSDFVAEAALLSRQIDRPVKVVWSREDEIRHGRYHPFEQTVYEGATDENGELSAWVAKSLTTHGQWQPGQVPLYAVPHVRLSCGRIDSVLNWGSWRSVLDHMEVLGNECFVDEIAHAVGRDPWAFRVRHLEKERERIDASGDDALTEKRTIIGRYLQVLDVLRERTGWGVPVPNGQGLGLAIGHHWSKAVCGHVVHVSVNGGQLEIRKITCVFHCGLAINPNSVRAQIEGSILWALTPVLHGGVTVQSGRVQESNFHDHPVVRMSETPEIEIHLIESDDSPSGVGEPVVPPLAPAVLNAIYAATGKRLRKLPVAASDLA